MTSGAANEPRTSSELEDTPKAHSSALCIDLLFPWEQDAEEKGQAV